MDKIIKKLIKKAETQAKGVAFLNTPDQLKNFYLSGLDKYTEWRALASIDDWLPVDREFLQDFRLKLDKRKVSTRVIMKADGLRFEPRGLKYRSVKTVPNSYTFRSSIDVLDDKILVMNPHMSVLGLVIESETLIDVFRDMFDMLWTSLPKQKK
ncbi:MAG: hypothetical protein V1664_03010 [Candidatus Uhrbacteria bacterium]